MKTTDNFKETIKEYLNHRAITDELFATSYSKPKKNIDECCNYILAEVQKSGCNGFTDDEIFSMAVHYYDEDNIKSDKSPNCRIVVNHVVELTEEEKKKAKEAAIKKLQDEAYNALKKKATKHKKVDESVEQMTLF